MKKISLFLFLLLSKSFIFAQNGQINPTSVQVPNVDGTSNVAAPSEGMVVYNKPDQSLYYRNSAEWVNLSNSLAAISYAPNVYYTITTLSPTPTVPAEITSGVHAGQTKALNFTYEGTAQTSVGGTGATVGKLQMSVTTFSKLRGNSDIPLWNILALGFHLGTIEFKYYDSNDVLYYSVKFTNAFLTQITNSAPDSPGGFASLENIKFVAQKIGWKDSSIPATPIYGTFDISTNTFSTSSSAY